MNDSSSDVKNKVSSGQLYHTYFFFSYYLSLSFLRVHDLLCVEHTFQISQKSTVAQVNALNFSGDV